MYAFRMSDGSGEKKAKGVRGYVVKGGLTFEDYVNCMKDPGKRHMVEMNGLRSYHQTMYSETVSKVGLSANDEKRAICEDGIHTLSYGHYKLKST
jgi:hypothetical protein